MEKIINYLKLNGIEHSVGTHTISYMGYYDWHVIILSEIESIIDIEKLILKIKNDVQY